MNKIKQADKNALIFIGTIDFPKEKANGIQINTDNHGIHGKPYLLRKVFWNKISKRDFL